MSLGKNTSVLASLVAGGAELLIYAPHTDEGKVSLEKVTLVPGLSLAKHATDYITLDVINKGADGAGTTVIGTINTSTATGQALTANVPVDIPITGAPIDLSYPLTLKKTDAAGTPSIGTTLIEVRTRNK